MKLPKIAHTSRPWRIHEITPDFRLEDVWALPTPGGPDDFPRLVRQFASADPSQSLPGAARALWALRWKLGELLGWDDKDDGVGSRVSTLRDRLPADLRDAPPVPEVDSLPFSSLYLREDEWAAEVANRTMHGVMHIGWVPDGNGALPRPDGGLGEAKWALRDRLHGRHQAVPAPDRVPGADAPHRAKVEGGQHAGIPYRSGEPRPGSASSHCSPTTSSSAVPWCTRPTRGAIRRRPCSVRSVRYSRTSGYTRQIGAPGAPDQALVFRARVGDREVEGCDFIHVGEDGLIDELYVMVRPPRA